MKVVIQQVDMDTALTAFLLGVSSTDKIMVVKAEASSEDLADPSVLCIEAGGSGRADRNNFDHHNTSLSLPPACRQALRLRSGQALEASGRDDPILLRLVDYVAAIDVAGLTALGPDPGFPTLSDLFSGMRLSIRNPAEQLKAGLSIFDRILSEKLDPFGLMPERAEWRAWLEARRQEEEGLKRARAEAQLFATRSGRQAGFLQTEFIGALGTLYRLGCEIAIAYSPRFGEPSAPKYTIGGNGIRVDRFLAFLNTLEPGWGGPASGTIIASPRTGSRLNPETVKHLIREHG